MVALAAGGSGAPASTACGLEAATAVDDPPRMTGSPQATVPGSSTHRLGILYMLGAAFFFSLMSLLVKIAGRTLPAMELVLARGVVTSLTSESRP